jgi:hypothetical protein
MKKFLAGVAAAVAYPIAVRIMRRASDAAIVRNVRRIERLVTRFVDDPLAATAVDDLRKIFEDPNAAALARRLILEARPAQFKATVRGAIW